MAIGVGWGGQGTMYRGSERAIPWKKEIGKSAAFFLLIQSLLDLSI